MKQLACLILTCLSTISFASHLPCYIGNRPGALTLTAGGGYFYLDPKRDLDNAGAGMIALGYDFTENWGIEGMLAVFGTEFDSDAVTRGKHVSGTFFSVNGAYHFLPLSAFQPYVLLGVGILGLSHSINDANNSGNINGAVGLQYFFSRNFSLRVEARDLYSLVNGRNDVFINAGIGVTFDLC